MRSRHFAQAVFICVLGFTSLQATAECKSVKDIERINAMVMDERVARIQGEDAIVFILLDPALSMPEFDDFPYRQDADVMAIRDLVAVLKTAGIDEVVIWRFKNRRSIGAAVAFADDCAVEGYGEPDLVEKLIAMKDAYERLTAQGPDDPDARNRIADIMRATPFPPTPLRIDAILAKVRPYLDP